MERDDIVQQILGTWKRHQRILLHLLEKVPAGGFTAVPAGSRGRDVARQFAHLDRVRRGWVHYHRTGKRPTLPRHDKGPPPSRAQLGKSLRASGAEVERFLRDALAGKVRPRLFGRQAVRWMGYLIAHESHHRGQILLALRQSGFKLPVKVTIEGLWGPWISGA